MRKRNFEPGVIPEMSEKVVDVPVTVERASETARMKMDRQKLDQI